MLAVKRLVPPRRALLSAALLSALVSGVEADAKPQTIEAEAPLGRLVSIGHHRLHLYCTGHGSPTVVLEAGIGGNHLDWIGMQPDLSKTTRVCSYDRAGYGWSEPGPKPRTASRIAGELERLLRNARIRGPIVLVGHSFGGALSLYYAGHHLDQVVGLVLIDSMHPDQYEHFQQSDIEVPTGPARNVVYSSRAALTFGIPQAYKALAYELARRDSARSFMLNELRNIRLSMTQVKDVKPARRVRAEVILHGRREWDRIYRDGRMENLWVRLQEDLARRVGAERVTISLRSGHQVHLEDPQLVEQMVLAVVREIRRRPD